MPGSTRPVVYVQLRPVRMVPTRLSVPEFLAITRLGSAPAPGTAVAEPVKVWSVDPSMRRVPVPLPLVEAWLIGPRAARVPMLNEPLTRLSVPSTVAVSVATPVTVPRRSRSKKGIAPLSVPAVRTTRLVPGSTRPVVYVSCARSGWCRPG